MDWTIFVDFGNVWYWVGIGVGLFALRVAEVLLRRLRLWATEASLDRIEARLPGLAEQAEAISVQLTDPDDTYEAMLHRNYHIHRHFGPVPGCPHCPQKA